MLPFLAHSASACPITLKALESKKEKLQLTIAIFSRTYLTLKNHATPPFQAIIFLELNWMKLKLVIFSKNLSRKPCVCFENVPRNDNDDSLAYWDVFLNKLPLVHSFSFSSSFCLFLPRSRCGHKAGFKRNQQR